MKLAVCLLGLLAACQSNAPKSEAPKEDPSGASLATTDTLPKALPSHVPGLPAGKSSLVLSLRSLGGMDGAFLGSPPDNAAGHPSSGTFYEAGEVERSTAAVTNILCFVYKPEHWSGKRMILVHHGVLRNADEYRDDSIVLGDKFDALVVAPQFDKERFPGIKYQRGGILKEDGTAALPQDWTYALVPKIAEAMRAHEGLPDMKYWIIGHSAGGQFAMRMSAFQDTGAERIVAANPGTDLFPTRDMPFGWGFGKLPESLSDDARLKRYLSAPLTLYLGTADDHPDEDLDMSPESVQQGGGRYQRGKAAFAMAQKLAKDKGWPLNWRLVEAPGIEHDHTKMFAHENCENALFGK